MHDVIFDFLTLCPQLHSLTMDYGSCPITRRDLLPSDVVPRLKEYNGPLDFLQLLASDRALKIIRLRRAHLFDQRVMEMEELHLMVMGMKGASSKSCSSTQ